MSTRELQFLADAARLLQRASPVVARHLGARHLDRTQQSERDVGLSADFCHCCGALFPIGATSIDRAARLRCTACKRTTRMTQRLDQELRHPATAAETAPVASSGDRTAPPLMDDSAVRSSDFVPLLSTARPVSRLTDSRPSAAPEALPSPQAPPIAPRPSVGARRPAAAGADNARSRERQRQRRQGLIAAAKSKPRPGSASTSRGLDLSDFAL